MMKFSLRELSAAVLPRRHHDRRRAAAAGLVPAARRATCGCRAQPGWPVALLALPNILGWHLFSILGVQELASGRAAILGFTMPIWTVLLAALFFGQRLTRARGCVGMASAGAAVALLVAHEVTALAGRPLGVLWMQLAARVVGAGHDPDAAHAR
ncbi:MAG: DMT family transporter [Comamonadaceae bacterium]|nr:DMT family transporter [Comamonadaceae bacterium]